MPANTYGVLLPKPAVPAAVSAQSANPPAPLSNAAGPVAAVEAVAGVAAEALAATHPEAAATAAQAAAILALADMIPGTPGPTPPSKLTVKAFSGGTSGGSGGGQVSGHGTCIPCKLSAALVGMPVNAVLGIKVLDGETDFALEAPLPLLWQRSYFSDIAAPSWLGQGWTLPFSPTLTRTAEGWLYTDEQGREVPYPDRFDTPPSGDDSEDFTFFDPYEQTAFSRLDTLLYQMASADGSSRMLFAPLTPDDTVYRLVALCDNNLNHIRITYNDNGLPEYLYDSAGRRCQIRFASVPLTQTDADFDPFSQPGVFADQNSIPHVNRLTSVILLSSDEHSTPLLRYGYNAYGDLSEVYGRDGKLLRTFSYRNHIMIGHGQPDGIQARYQYDRYSPDGRVLRSETNLGQSWSFDYRSGFTCVTDALGRTTTYGYDHNRELIYQIDADGNRSDTERDDYGRIILARDSLGRETRYRYDFYGNLLSVTAPDGSHTRLSYEDPHNDSLVTEITQSDGSSTQYAYDPNGNLISETDALGYRTHYRYDHKGLPVCITDPLGKDTTLSYNAAGQLVRHTDCSDHTTTLSYTPDGEIRSITDPLGHTTVYHYDKAGNHIATDYPDHSREHYGYDHLNRLVSHTDAEGSTTAYTLAPDGLPVRRTDALGHTFDYSYDVARRLSTLTNENRESYLLRYDANDNLISETGWDGKVSTYAYDAAGQLIRHTEHGITLDSTLPPVRRIHHFKRNLLGQLTEKISRTVLPTHSRHKNHGISRTRFDYDPFGPMGSHRLVRARNAHSSIELSYDALGRILSETLTHKGQQSTLSYEYDANGNSIRTHLPDGRSLNRLYYGSGHLHHINLDGQTLTDIERDALHRPIERSQGSLSTRFGYDPMGRLQSQNIGNIIRRRYHYDKVGNLIQSSDSRNGTTQYVYDKIGRILEAVNPSRGTQEKFAFDPASNITDPKNHRSALGNRLPEYNGTQYTYDDLGNLIYRELPDGETQHLIYDSENQLSEVNIRKADGEHQRWRYAYDPFGRRISKERTDKGSLTSTAPKQTVFIWDGSRIVQEYHYKGHYTYIYTDQDSYEPLAQVFYNNQDDKDYLSHYHTDQIGIPREQTDQFGNLLWAGEYDAWGKLNHETKIYPNAHQPFRLQNQYYDPETGLHYNLFRYYDPNCGRFINQDPIGLDGGDNLYQFAPNTSKWIDVSGAAAQALGGCALGSPFGGPLGCGVGAFLATLVVVSGGSLLLSSSSSTSQTASSRKCTHGNCRNSIKPQHGYMIYQKSTGQIMEFGISGQTRTAADKGSTINNSPRIRQKLKQKYGNNPDYAGCVLIDGMPDRATALAWEAQQVNDYRSKHNGRRPPMQFRP